jgi:hypothetical protein
VILSFCKMAVIGLIINLCLVILILSFPIDSVIIIKISLFRIVTILRAGPGYCLDTSISISMVLPSRPIRTL